MEEELCKKVVEVRRRSDRVMTVVMMLEEEVLRIMCMVQRVEHFYDDLRSEWDMQSVGELVLGMGDFNGHVGKRIEGYEDVHGGYGIGERNVEEKMLLEFCDEKELCVANTWFRKGEK